MVSVIFSLAPTPKDGISFYGPWRDLCWWLAQLQLIAALSKFKLLLRLRCVSEVFLMSEFDIDVAPLALIDLIDLA